MAALGLVGLTESVTASGGLLREVHEKGSNFSVGTVQLFCLARVLLKKPKIIFMDEVDNKHHTCFTRLVAESLGAQATASVDMRTDTAVQETIRRVFGECTIVTIAHRLQVVNFVLFKRINNLVLYRQS